MNAPICTRRLPGRTHECRTVMRIETTHIGIVRYVCDRCERQRAGCCWKCGVTRTNHPTNGMFCTSCVKAARRAERQRRKHRPDVVAKRRQHDAHRWRQSATRRASVSAARKRWQAKHRQAAA